MSTKSQKNILIIVLLSSLALFVAAIIWKNSQPSNEEVVNVSKKVVKKKPKKKQDLSFLEDEFIQDDAINEDNRPASPEHRKKLTSRMNMAIMYKTPEQIMESLVFYQDKGQDDKVDELLAFLLERFPDYEVPADFE